MIFGQPFTSSNGKTDKLAKRGALLKPFTVPCSLSSLTPQHHSLLLLNCEHTAKSKFFIIQIPSVSTEELVLTHYARSVLSRLCFKRVSLLLNSCFSIIGRVENSPCNVYGHSTQGISHFILLCPATNSIRQNALCQILCCTQSLVLAVGFLGLHCLRLCPHSEKGSGNDNIISVINFFVSILSFFKFNFNLVCFF